MSTWKIWLGVVVLVVAVIAGRTYLVDKETTSEPTSQTFEERFIESARDLNYVDENNVWQNEVGTLYKNLFDKEEVTLKMENNQEALDELENLDIQE